MALPFHLVRQADGGCFGDGRVADQGALHFGGAQAVAADLDHIVHTPDDPDIAVLVLAGRVACLVHISELAPILARVALGVI